MNERASASATFEVEHAYRPRPVASEGVTTVDGWSIKTYRIVHDEATFADRSFDEAVALALSDLPRPAVAEQRPGVAIVIKHAGDGASYLVLGWWDRENELPLRVFVLDGEGWRASRGSESLCVWDLELLSVERDAYVRLVLSDKRADLDGYLSFVAALDP